MASSRLVRIRGDMTMTGTRCQACLPAMFWLHRAEIERISAIWPRRTRGRAPSFQGHLQSYGRHYLSGALLLFPNEAIEAVLQGRTRPTDRSWPALLDSLLVFLLLQRRRPPLFFYGFLDE
jgi:hypothetical protein